MAGKIAFTQRRLAFAAVGLVAFLTLWVAIELLFLPDPAMYAKKNPEKTALQLARDEEAKEHGKKARFRQSWMALKDIDPLLINAVLISEDAGFWGHDGVDLHELKNAAEEALEQGHLTRGASTITQQLAKNLWLSADRSLLRKLKELVLALKMERRLSKSRILALYLNEIEWGDGIWGVDAAAHEHFGASAGNLTPSEAVMLASMLPAPRKWTPASRSPQLRSRSLRLLDKLVDAHRLDAAAATRAREAIDDVLGKGDGADSDD